MPASHWSAPIWVVFLLLSLAAPVAAQPTLPRERISGVTGTIRSLVDRLYSPDPKERAEAACQLGRRREDAASAIPVLLSMLGDDVVVPAIECEMGSWARNLPMTAEARKWMETSPAKEAAEALGDIGNAAVPGLVAALEQSDWKVRKFAAIGLGELDRIDEVASVVTALGNHLADAHPDVRDRSAWALGEIEHPSAVEPLVRAFHDSDARVRTRIAWALGEIEHPSAVDALVAALKDSDAAVREKSVWALGEIESDLAVEGLVPLLGDADPKVRRQVAWALGEIESAAAVPALVQSLTDTEITVRRQAAWALGEIEHPSAVDALCRALADNDAQVRRTAAWALGEIEDPSAIDELRAAANDENAEVRRAVAHALRELGDRRRQ
jgi:HEAT repeat protein